jgi:hypothetical protein
MRSIGFSGTASRAPTFPSLVAIVYPHQVLVRTNAVHDASIVDTALPDIAIGRVQASVDLYATFQKLRHHHDMLEASTPLMGLTIVLFEVLLQHPIQRRQNLIESSPNSRTFQRIGILKAWRVADRYSTQIAFLESFRGGHSFHPNLLKA